MTQKKEINGVTFQVAPFMAIEGLRLKAHLVKTFGPALGELLGGIDIGKDGGIGELQLNRLDVVIERLMVNLTEDSFIALLKRLFANVIATWIENGKSRSIAFGNDFDTAMQLVFVGRLFSVYPLVGFILEVNYPDFFDKAVKGIGRRIRATLTSATEDGTLSGESGKSETSAD
jgi:hypothetical protein